MKNHRQTGWLALGLLFLLAIGWGVAQQWPSTTLPASVAERPAQLTDHQPQPSLTGPELTSVPVPTAEPDAWDTPLEPAPVAKELPAPAGTEAEILKLNTQPLPFVTQFKEVPVTPKHFVNYLQKLRDGYKLDLQTPSFIATPTLHQGTLYAPGGFGSQAFYAFEAATGQLKWAVNLHDDGPSAAVVTDSAVLFNTESCTVFALNAQTGQLRWSKWLGDPLMTSPVTDGQTLFTAYPSMTLAYNPEKTADYQQLKPSHAFVALEAATGQIKWQCWLDGDVMTTPVLDHHDLFIATFNGTLYRINKKNGQILAAVKLKATSAPSLAGEQVLITQRVDIKGAPHEAVTILNRRTLRVQRTLEASPAPYLDAKLQAASKLKGQYAKWDANNGFAGAPVQSGASRATDLLGHNNVSALQNHLGSYLLVSNNRAYNCQGDKIVCRDLSTYQTRWTLPLPGNLAQQGGHLATAPILAGPYVISATVGGNVLFIDRESGQVKRWYKSGKPVRSQPIAVAGNVYLPTLDGELVCIQTGDTRVDGWPMLMRNPQHNPAL